MKFKKNSKQRLEKLQRVAEKKKLRFKDLKRLKNKLKLGIPKHLSRNYNRKDNSKSSKYKLKHIIAPSNFSFIDNTFEMVEFISRIQEQYHKKKGVFIVMDNVQSVGHDAIVVLLSVMVKYEDAKIPFNGSFPDNKDAKKIVIASGFIESLYKRTEFGQYYLLGRNNKILTTGWTNVDPQLGQKIMEDITPRIFGEKRIIKGLQNVLLELMQNSHNHANLEKAGVKDWWLSVNTDNDTASFSYIDYGVGIFESLKNKKEDHVFKVWFNKALSLFQNNAQILKKILDGEMHQTTTNQYFRGKGLPAIMVALDRKYITKLYIVTNNVFASVENGVYKTMDIDFNGTFVYWEINKNTTTHPWTL